MVSLCQTGTIQSGISNVVHVIAGEVCRWDAYNNLNSGIKWAFVEYP